MNFLVLPWILFGYAVGSVPFAYLLARRAGIDVRVAGSGNVGAANVLRTTGMPLGLTVMMLDIGKGAATVETRSFQSNEGKSTFKTIFRVWDLEQNRQRVPAAQIVGQQDVVRYQFDEHPDLAGEPSEGRVLEAQKGA